MGGLQQDSKARLRRDLLTRRAALRSDAVAEASVRISRILTGAPAFRGARHLVLYAARAGEVDPAPLAADALARGIPTYYPRIEEGLLEFRLATLADLRPGAHGIPEPSGDAPRLPADAEGIVILVPGLAFDRAGRRLGSGRGYYDRALPRRPAAMRIGLVLEAFVADRLPSDAWDVPMNAVATENGLFTADVSVGVQPGDHA